MKTNKDRFFRKKFLTLLLTLIFTLLLPGRATAQGMPVYDNTNFLSLGKQLIESAKQTAELLNMVEELNAVREKIEKVNNAVRQYQAVRDITKNNEELFEMVGDDLREVLNSPYIHGDEVEVITNAFNGIMEHSLNQLDFMEQVLSNDFLNMSDAERLKILEDQREASQRMLVDIKLKKRRYDMVISFRKMKTLIKDRKLNY
ncbi:conjugal transfer protein [Muricauda oceani]|uniref:Conjugal transfer protein n=1 Tax=Flagellimonas oceani TaxID=2698672 RepID=A0A6G7J5Z6_9FLAO|nr:conjugal transfer protein [Allomuricauda oceani]MBW8242552.1 conjugal transfer protein [Allomuricauda oceani]QII46311.1 conjugal transfer protein [Allomuricauda oceani]